MSFYNFIEKIAHIFPKSGLILYNIYYFVTKFSKLDESPILNPQNREAIVLIPGRHNNTNCFKKIIESKILLSYNIYPFNYDTTAPIAAILPDLIEYRDQIPENVINIISHSKGGLLAKSATLLTNKKINRLEHYLHQIKVPYLLKSLI